MLIAEAFYTLVFDPFIKLYFQIKAADDRVHEMFYIFKFIELTKLKAMSRLFVMLYLLLG